MAANGKIFLERCIQKTFYNVAKSEITSKAKKKKKQLPVPIELCRFLYLFIFVVVIHCLIVDTIVCMCLQQSLCVSC